MNFRLLSKTVVACIILILASLTTSAQTAQTEMDIIQDAFGLDKKMAVASVMKLEDKADKFWSLYDKYEAERKKLGKKRIEVIAKYAESYPTISDKQISKLYKETRKIRKSFDKLQDKYFKKMKKELGVSKAAQFWQLENYFNVMIQANIYSQLPFIGEEIGN